MSVTIKQVIIGTVVGTTVVGVAILRIRQEVRANERPTQVAKSHETDQASRKHLG